MNENKKDTGMMDWIKNGFGLVSQIISASVYPQLAEGAEIVMKNIDERMLRLEKRLLTKMRSLMAIMLGGVLLILALLFFLIENLSWSYSRSFFSVGIIIFVAGLTFKIMESNG